MERLKSEIRYKLEHPDIITPVESPLIGEGSINPKLEEAANRTRDKIIVELGLDKVLDS